MSTDHPRSRGVYPVTPGICAPNWGSSPLARGLHRRRHAVASVARIIPARAGFTPRMRKKAPATEDHPRSRGVYSSARSPCGASCGSSPLARGLPALTVAVTEAAGIIPARAGFTRRCDPDPGHCADHPRSRGVYVPLGLGWSVGLGSSPLARGLPRFSEGGIVGWWIIPARAGFT